MARFKKLSDRMEGYSGVGSPAKLKQLQRARSFRFFLFVYALVTVVVEEKYERFHNFNLEMHNQFPTQYCKALNFSTAKCPTPA